MSDRIELLLSAEEIARRVAQVAAELAPRLQGEDVVVIGLLKGAFVFMADLIRALHGHGVKPHIDFMVTSSYGKRAHTSGNVSILLDTRERIEGRRVLLIDDILDSGTTLAFVMDHLRGQNPRELISCVFLDKPERRTASVAADYTCFSIPNHFVVGYGLDYANDHRELPFVGVVKTSQ